VIGRIDHLREMVWQGPQPEDEVDAAVENDLEEPTPTAVDRVRRILGRD
jgi:hypothetical protein